MSLDRDDPDKHEAKDEREESKDFFVDEKILKSKIDEIKRKMREKEEVTLEEKILFHLYLKTK